MNKLVPNDMVPSDHIPVFEVGYFGAWRKLAGFEIGVVQIQLEGTEDLGQEKPISMQFITVNPICVQVSCVYRM